MLRAQENDRGGTDKKNGKQRSRRTIPDSAPALKDLGDQSSRWHTLAENPKAVEKYLRECDDDA
jgi:hypothetical protein